MATGETMWIGGSGRIKRFEASNGKPKRTFINLSFKKADLEKLYVSEKGYVFVQLIKKEAPDQYGNEFSMMQDQFQVDRDIEKNGGQQDPFDDTANDEEL